MLLLLVISLTDEYCTSCKPVISTSRSMFMFVQHRFPIFIMGVYTRKQCDGDTLHLHTWISTFTSLFDMSRLAFVIWYRLYAADSSSTYQSYGKRGVMPSGVHCTNVPLLAANIELLLWKYLGTVDTYIVSQRSWTLFAFFCLAIFP